MFVVKPPKPKTADRISRAQVDKFAERRVELAAAALKTLSELGYARTSLREIALNTDFSHGVLHYYFADKLDLILCAVLIYNTECVKRYDGILASANNAAHLERGFGQAMAATLLNDGPMHRLWYDLRNQSLFETSFQEGVAEIDGSLEKMIWRIVTAYAALSGQQPRVDSPTAYAIFDGVFQKALLAHRHGDASAPAALARQVEQVLSELIFEVRKRPAKKRVSRSAGQLRAP